eukprot:COSAG02_NODE_1137_length_14313_cov_6.111369_19_plen_75_part_00
MVVRAMTCPRRAANLGTSSLVPGNGQFGDANAESRIAVPVEFPGVTSRKARRTRTDLKLDLTTPESGPRNSYLL